MLKKLVILCVLIPSFAFSGAESGGGGGIAWINGRAVLLDFLQVMAPAKAISLTERLSSKDIIPEDEFRMTPEIVSSNEAFSRATAILKQWQELPLDTESVLVNFALTYPVWSFTDSELSAPPAFRPPFLPTDAATEVAAFYKMKGIKQYSVQISRPHWSKLGLHGQTGLIIHETLRHVQIGFESRFNDEALQQATAIFMLCKPSARLNFYIRYLLNDGKEIADNIYGSFPVFFEKRCVKQELE